MLYLVPIFKFNPEYMHNTQNLAALRLTTACNDFVRKHHVYSDHCKQMTIVTRDAGVCVLIAKEKPDIFRHPFDTRLENQIDGFEFMQDGFPNVFTHRFLVREKILKLYIDGNIIEIYVTDASEIIFERNNKTPFISDRIWNEVDLGRHDPEHWFVSSRKELPDYEINNKMFRYEDLAPKSRMW